MSKVIILETSSMREVVERWVINAKNEEDAREKVKLLYDDPENLFRGNMDYQLDDSEEYGDYSNLSILKVEVNDA
jgi:hypothetical protein